MNLEQVLATLRPMTRADLDTVVAVEISAYGHPWTRGNFADSLASGYLCEALPDCAADSGEAPSFAGRAPSGAICAYFVAMPGVDELHLLNITVAPAAQGQGLGRALMQVVQARCCQLGLAQLLLEVRESNHRARSLYQRLGFAQVGVRRGYYPARLGREDAVVMRLAVTPSEADSRLADPSTSMPEPQAAPSQRGTAP